MLIDLLDLGANQRQRHTFNLRNSYFSFIQNEGFHLFRQIHWSDSEKRFGYFFSYALSRSNLVKQFTVRIWPSHPLVLNLGSPNSMTCQPLCSAWILAHARSYQRFQAGIGGGVGLECLPTEAAIMGSIHGAAFLPWSWGFFSLSVSFLFNIPSQDINLLSSSWILYLS